MLWQKVLVIACETKKWVQAEACTHDVHLWHKNT